jgi:hypothetical protein
MKDEKPKADAKAKTVIAPAVVPAPTPATVIFGLDAPAMPTLVFAVDKKTVEKIVERMKEL